MLIRSWKVKLVPMLKITPYSMILTSIFCRHVKKKRKPRSFFLPQRGLKSSFDCSAQVGGQWVEGHTSGEGGQICSSKLITSLTIFHKSILIPIRGSLQIGARTVPPPSRRQPQNGPGRCSFACRSRISASRCLSASDVACRSAETSSPSHH